MFVGSPGLPRAEVDTYPSWPGAVLESAEYPAEAEGGGKLLVAFQRQTYANLPPCKVRDFSVRTMRADAAGMLERYYHAKGKRKQSKKEDRVATTGKLEHAMEWAKGQINAAVDLQSRLCFGCNQLGDDDALLLCDGQICAAAGLYTFVQVEWS